MIKEHLANLLEETRQLSKHVTAADEFVATDDIKRAINELELLIFQARKTFERTKKIEDEDAR